MIGDDIAQALPELQAQAESMMTESCVIKRPDGTTTNGDGEVVTAYESTPVYSGPCRVRSRASSASEEVGGGETLTATRSEVHVPVSAGDVFLPSDAVFFGDVLTYRVVEGHDATYQTAIRLPVERVR